MPTHLSSLYTRRAELTATKRDYTQALETIKLAMTPTLGWDGKNQDTRDLARDKAWAADEEVIQLSADVASLEHDLTIIVGDIESAEAERRAEEWAIRARYVAVREREAGIEPQPVGTGGDTMLDDALPFTDLDDIDF